MTTSHSDLTVISYLPTSKKYATWAHMKSILKIQWLKESNVPDFYNLKQKL